MIRLVRIDDFIDSRALLDLTQEVRNCSTEDFEELIQRLPPLKELIKAIPRSLPLLDAVYEKFEKYDNHFHNIFRKHLETDSLINRIIWWLAQINQTSVIGSNINDEHNLVSPRGNVLQFTRVKCHISSILGIIQRENPEIVDEIFVEKNQLSECLDALGCHGLVNCTTGMIRLVDASMVEMLRLQDKLKAVIIRFKEMQKQKSLLLDESPNKASHQRQLNLKLSEIFDRLKQNEAIEKVLDELLTNTHLMSLLRIVRKRVRADRALINIYTSYNNTKPEGFQICEVNPIVAKLIVIFKNAYGQLTSLVPSTDDSDSGLPPESSNFSDNFNGSNQTTINLAKSSVFLENDSTDDLFSKKSTKTTNSGSSKENQTTTSSEESRVTSMHSNPEEPRWITLPIYSTPTEIEEVMHRFATLFHGQRSQILAALEELNEFHGKEELQLKTMMSAIVLTYRSVFETSQRQYFKIYDALESTQETDLIMDYSIYRMMHRHARTERGMQNAREVTSQIWDTLYDFPSLKTCTRFNRFVLDCVDVVWDMVAGIDGRLPRIKIEYDFFQSPFDPSKHMRFETADMKSTVIKHCMWPALLDTSDNKYMLKAVVLT
uniref:Mitochondria-eating protein n=1 Tax=Panagrellus redivivus TaxID=6233 RepID=A0A7E4W341_PANRE